MTDTMPVPQTAAEAIAQCRDQGLAEPEKVARKSWPELFVERSKPTPGPWLYEESTGEVYSDEVYCTICVALENSRGYSNGPLIAEAGTVLHDTGLTPRELQKQRDELLAALKPLADVLLTHDGHIIGLMREDIRKARAAIASVEGGVS